MHCLKIWKSKEKNAKTDNCNDTTSRLTSSLQKDNAYKGGNKLHQC